MPARNEGAPTGGLRGARFFLLLSLLALAYLFCTTLIVLSTGGGTWKCGSLAIHLTSMGAPLSTFWYVILAGAFTLMVLNRRTRGACQSDSVLVPGGRHLLPVLLVFFIIAFMVRLYRIEVPPVEFHPTRQYNNALIARHFFVMTHGAQEAWQENFYRVEDFYLEPPLIELISTGFYHLLGTENLSVPGLLSICFWLVGALVLYRGARLLAGTDAAIIALFFFLFLPFAIMCSRCFMPDPLMTSLLSLYILMLASFMEKPCRSRLILAAAAGAMAVFAKAGAIFPVITGMAGLLVFWREGRKKVSVPDILLFPVIVVLPAWLYGLVAYGGSSLKGKLWGRFLPSLLGTSFNLQGWLGMIDSVLGLALLLLALLSLFLFRGTSRILLASLLAGYLFFLLIFNYHSATHDYYHMMLIPLAVIMLGRGGSWACSMACLYYSDKQVRRGACAVAAVLVLAFCTAGVARLTPAEVRSQVALYEKVGEVVHHSRNTFILAPSYGLPLRYHGWVEGFSWPDSRDLRYWAWEGVPVQDPLAYFRKMAGEKKPDYFIVLAPSEWAGQESVSAYVEKHYPLIWSEGEGKIFNLGGKGFTP